MGLMRIIRELQTEGFDIQPISLACNCRSPAGQRSQDSVSMLRSMSVCQNFTTKDSSKLVG